VETVPTPEENIVLLPYFLKMGNLNGFRPCNLAERENAQKKDNPFPNPETRARPALAMAEH